jgi:peptidoglycan-associated lipoprotein
MKKRISNATVAPLALMAMLLVGGCSQKNIQSTDMTQPASVTASSVANTGLEQRPQSSGKNTSIVTSSLDESAPVVESLETAPNDNVWQNKYALSREGRSSGPLLPVYFDFDRFHIKQDQIPRIEDNASFIKKQAGVKIRIEGNCDERGTYEYNMALGERRAIGAKKIMVDLGIEEARLDTLSYGEERPLYKGHDESIWAQNRRGDFVIEN